MASLRVLSSSKVQGWHWRHEVRNLESLDKATFGEAMRTDVLALGLLPNMALGRRPMGSPPPRLLILQGVMRCDAGRIPIATSHLGHTMSFKF